MLHLADTPLAAVLGRPLADTPSARAYQAELDRLIDGLRPRWNLESGTLTDQDRTGREATAPLCWAAFCHYSPLSRHRRDPELLRFFSAGLRTFVDSIDDHGLMSRFGLNGESWAHGWDVEGLIYGLHFCREELAAELLDHVESRFRLSARRFADLPRTPGIIGSYGNQRTVWTLGLHLYGQILADAELIDIADYYFKDALEKVLDGSGQVIEQQGPCQHYSFTAFFYTWLNLVIRGNEAERERVRRCLGWFRQRYTDDGTPIAGPSTRQYAETMKSVTFDLLPAAEQLAAIDPMPREWLRDCLSRMTTGTELPIAHNHGTTPALWALLLTPGEVTPTPEQRAAWEAPHFTQYSSTNLLKRSPLKYVLIRRGYQTHYNFTDFMPFAGVQTWAWGGEPPILHPTPLAPSTTEAWGVDTARMGSSHNWGLYGAGALGIDGYVRDPGPENALPLLVSRHGWLWRVVLFTEVSTVIYEFGGDGPRRTSFTLNRLAPAAPIVEPGRIRFEGRTGCLCHSQGEPPRIESRHEDHAWAAGVRQLVFEIPSGVAAFALSNGSCELLGDWRFRDETGAYRFVPRPGWLTEANPGNFSVDTFQQAHQSCVIKE